MAGVIDPGPRPAAGLSCRLARFVCDTGWDDLPPVVRDHAVRSVFNGFGTALGGSSDAVITRLSGSLAPFSAQPQATAIGHAHRFDMPTAAFLNAAAVNVFDFDDSHAGTIIHPTAPILPVVLALAETHPVSGADLLLAFTLGVEIACRIGNAVSPQHYDRGWHITSTCGIFGAAAAAAKLLRLSEEQTLWALGNASAQSSGLVETLGYMAKSVGVGAAARNGLMAALMARAGVEGPPAPIEGPRGFLAVCCDQPRPDRIEDGLGANWEMLRNMFKPYPCGVVLNPVIDACLGAHAHADFDVAQIAGIVVRGNPLLKARTDRPDAATGREAQVSAQHAVAVSLMRASAGAADFSDAAAADPALMALRRKVDRIEADPAIPVDAVRITVRRADGQTVDLAEDTASGSLRRPMTDPALRAKFAALARYGCPSVDADSLAAALWSLADMVDAGSIMALARPPRPGSTS